MMIIASGDSITAGYIGNPVPASGLYINNLSNSLATSVLQKAVSGAQVADQSFAFTGYAPTTSDKHTVLIGANDVRLYGPAKVDFYHKFLTALLLSVCAPQRIAARSSGMDIFGSWSNTVVNQIGKNTTTKGVKASATVSGTAVYISYIIQDHPAAGGVADVRIDGVLVGQINSGGLGMSTQNGLTYAPGCVRFAGLSDGDHRVEVEVTSSGKIFYLEYISGAQQSERPRVYVGTIIRQRYSGFGSDSTVSLYNDGIMSIVSDLLSDGMFVNVVETSSSVDPVSDLADGIHPNQTGHGKISASFLAVMQQAGVVSVPAAVTRHEPFDGRYFVGDGINRRELVLK